MSRIAGIEIQVFRNESSSQTNAYSHYSNYSYSGLIPNERTPSSSCHPQHTKKAIPFSLALRIRRICSTNANFTLRLNELRTYLLARGYGNTFLDSQFKRATNISRTEALNTSRHDFIDRLPFVVTYNPSLPHISNVLRKYFHILLSSKRCSEVCF